MRVSYRWLRELLPSLQLDPSEVATRLSLSGLAVDGMTSFGAGVEQVQVVTVQNVTPHPKRSGLRLVTVDRGGAVQTVVCGASNVPDPGHMVLLAPLGAVLPKLGVALERREIGGVVSEGMLCSETELGLADSSEGIVVLPPGTARAGSRASEVLPFASDTIYELDITPNRPDALGHIGVARDLAAICGLKFELPAPSKLPRSSSESLERLITIENQDTERCPHYGGAAALRVTVKPSPSWLRFRLFSLGVRPISNVVDITNLLMLEYGHPMHAFDLERVRGRKIIIRRARPSEPFTTLDGVARTLDGDDLVIGDAEGPSALAGIMGGLDSEIRDETRSVLLECAYFAPRGIRRTARRHGMHTESSHRFERGVDPENVTRVLERAQVLLAELADAEPVPGIIHARSAAQSLPSIGLRSKRLDQLLGTNVPFDDALRILNHLGFSTIERSADSAELRAASHRPDVRIEADLIEEVARIRGLDAIPTRLPAVAPKPPRNTGQLERRLVAHAVELGLSEALTYAFVSARELSAVRAPDAVVHLTNPLSEDRNVMRTSLLPGLLDALKRSRRYASGSVALFTLGSVFLDAQAHGQKRSAEAEAARPRLPDDQATLPIELPRFTALLSGPRPAYLGGTPAEYDAFDAKGLALELTLRLTGREARTDAQRDAAAFLHPRAAARVYIGERVVGVFGTLHPDVADAFDLDTGAQIVELYLDELEREPLKAARYRPIPRLPAVTRDVAFELPEEVPAGAVLDAIRSAAGELCESVELFDLFRGGSIAQGRRSLAFHVIYRDPKAATAPESARTLTDKEVDERQAAVIRAVTEQLGGTIRG